LGPWATANYCRAGIKSLRGTIINAIFYTSRHLLNNDDIKVVFYINSPANRPSDICRPDLPILVSNKNEGFDIKQGLDSWFVPAFSAIADR
jgi:hypothetical protein